MALFDRYDERDFGRRGEQGRARGEGLVDRAGDALRRGWERLEDTFEGQDVRRAGEFGPEDEHLRRDYESRSAMDRAADYRGRDAGIYDRGTHPREGLWSNSWSDGAWTADAADRTDRDWHLGDRYDRDVRPAEAGWRAGGMRRGGTMRGGMGREREWNLRGGERGWGHDWGSGGARGGYRGGGMDYDRDFGRGRGFVDRAEDALRRGWDRVEDAFDRDEDRGPRRDAMRGGTSRAGNYDREFGRFGSSGTLRYGGGMDRYGLDYERGQAGPGRGYKGREQTDAGDPFGDRQHRTPIRMVNEGEREWRNRGRYDAPYRRNWF